MAFIYRNCSNCLTIKLWNRFNRNKNSVNQMENRNVNLFLKLLFCLSSEIWHFTSNIWVFCNEIIVNLGPPMTIIHQLLSFIEL